MSQVADAVSADANLRRTALWGTQWGQLDGLAGFSCGLRTGCRSTGRALRRSNLTNYSAFGLTARPGAFVPGDPASG
jgi:hypothetical protein